MTVNGLLPVVEPRPAMTVMMVISPIRIIVDILTTKILATVLPLSAWMMMTRKIR